MKLRLFLASIVLRHVSGFPLLRVVGYGLNNKQVWVTGNSAGAGIGGGSAGVLPRSDSSFLFSLSPYNNSNGVVAAAALSSPGILPKRSEPPLTNAWCGGCSLTRARHQYQTSGRLQMSASSSASETVEANDGEALQQLFSKFCDDEGLMTFGVVEAIPFFAELVEDEDLLPSELRKIWAAAPKFPEMDPSIQEQRIDVDSFIQIYRDVDDLFEEEEKKKDVAVVAEEKKKTSKSSKANKKLQTIQPEESAATITEPTSKKDSSAPTTKKDSSAPKTKKDAPVPTSKNDAPVPAPVPVTSVASSEDQKQLTLAFETICDSAGRVSKKALRGWAEVDDLMLENMLDEAEFDGLWEKTTSRQSTDSALDLNGFLGFNAALDDLFEMDEDDEPPSAATTTNKSPPEVVVGEDLPPGVIFSQLANRNDLLVGVQDLRRWKELADVLKDGSLLETELESMIQNIPKAPGTTDKFDEAGFTALYEAIDDLFEEDKDEEEATALSSPREKPMVVGDDLPSGVIFSQLADETFLVGLSDLKRWQELLSFLEDGDLLESELQNIFDKSPKAPGTEDKLNEEGFEVLYDAIEDLFEEEEEAPPTPPTTPRISKKTELLALLTRLERDEDGNEVLSCGLEADEEEQSRVLDLVTNLETEPNNKMLALGGAVTAADLTGSWDLLYTSSGMMRFNKGLSGLGGSFPNGRFGGLRQTLIATKYLTDVEYIERINATPDINSFDVRVNGDWQLKSSVSLLTGAPSTIMAVEPDKVSYGPTTTRADHWKSVRAMNLLDLSYLDDDLRIMRGNTSTDTLFIFRKYA